jgi:hypothetical protein
MAWGDRAAEQHEKDMPSFPVIVVHLEDPPGSGRAACCGHRFQVPEGHPNVPRWACTGCTNAAMRP